MEILEILVDCVQWFLLRSGDEKNGGVSTFDGVLLVWWFVVWNRVCYFDVSNREWGVQWLFNWFCSLFGVGIRPSSFLDRGLSFDWFGDWFSNWLWGGFNNWLNNLWFSEIFFICSLAGILLTLFLCELSSLDINKLDIVNSLGNSKVRWFDQHLG